MKQIEKASQLYMDFTNLYFALIKSKEKFAKTFLFNSSKPESIITVKSPAIYVDISPLIKFAVIAFNSAGYIKKNAKNTEPILPRYEKMNNHLSTSLFLVSKS